MPYRYLLFDADDTLFDFRAAEKNAFTAVFRAFGYPNGEKEYHVYHEENKRCWQELEKGLCTRPQLLYNRFERTFRALGIEGDPAAVQKAYMEELAENGIVYPETRPLLDRLKPLFKLVLITNGAVHIQNRRLEKSHMAHYFDGIYISEQMGCAKPDPAYFHQVLADLNVTDLRQVLVIGDSLTSDVQGAVNAGLDICWFNPHHKENTAGLPVSYEIDRIGQLLPILGLEEASV